MRDGLLPVLVLLGPTAIGKSALAVDLAETLGAEIISADSRQIYRFMDIATAKPSAEALRRVPHHFIDRITPDQTYSAGLFAEEARVCADAILSRNRRVIVAGGSGLYTRSMLEGFFEGTIRDDEIRNDIRRTFAERGSLWLFEQLRSVDPETASRLSPNDARRVERALEVFRVTGTPISQWHKKKGTPFRHPVIKVGLTGDRNALYRRIDERVDRMLLSGVIDETKELLAMGYDRHSIAMESLGYREIIAYLDGTLDHETMVSRFKQGTRNYAKRQWTWFRKEKDVHWFDVFEESDLLKKVLNVYQNG